MLLVLEQFNVCEASELLAKLMHKQIRANDEISLRFGIVKEWRP